MATSSVVAGLTITSGLINRKCFQIYSVFLLLHLPADTCPVVDRPELVIARPAAGDDLAEDEVT